METLIKLVLGVLALFVVLYVAGRIKGEPVLETLTYDGLKLQIWLLDRWIKKYKTLQNPDATLRAMYEHKTARVEKAKSLLPPGEYVAKDVEEPQNLSPFADVAAHRILAVAKEKGISADAAGNLLFKDAADKKKKYMDAGMEMRAAEVKALAEVFGA